MDVCVLGPVEVVGEAGAIRLPGLKQRRLLTALVVAAGKTQPVDVLVEAVWEDTPPPSAAKLVQVYVSQLRKVFADGVRIETRGGGYSLELDPHSLDAARFERLLAEGTAARRDGNPELALSLLGRGLALWRGAAYGEFAYCDFARADAERLEELRMLAFEARFEAQLALGEHAEVLPALLSLAAEHPLRERVQAHAMLALYRCGRQSEALDLCATVSRRLYRELGVEPSVELRALQRRMLQQDADLVVTVGPAPRLRELPEPPNKLLGRRRELGELRTLLFRDDVRLLVLAGAGGSGKTRLALEAARNVASLFANGVAFVSLAELREPRLLVETMARALEIEAVAGEEPFDSLANALRGRELLLVLDNAEHLRPSTRFFAELLARAPRLTLLVTSRIVLHLSGEHVYAVNPLDEEDATALFVERARDADPHFAPDAADLDAIRRVCRRVDGLPLAIELAAGRTRTIAPIELLDRLEPCLPLLAGGPRDVAARQQTLRATLEWSYELLGENAKRDLARLAVFAGGCTLTAAEAVCETTLDSVASLLDHNLIRRSDRADATRYTMLETVREYADERLDESGEKEVLRRRHAEWVRELAEAAAPELSGSTQTALLERLSVEHANIRVAIEFALRSGDAELALSIVASLGRYWPVRGHIHEGRLWLDASLAIADEVPYQLRMNALYWQSDLAGNLDDHAVAEHAAEAALALARAHDDNNGIARSAFRLGCARFHEDPTESERLLDVAAAAAANAGAKGTLAAIGTLRGRMLLVKADPRAAAVLSEAATQFRKLADTQNFAEAQVYAALAAIECGRANEARPLLDESLRICAELRSPMFIGVCLQGFAALAIDEDDVQRAAALLVRADGLFDATAARLPGPERELYDRLRSDVRDRLTEGELELIRATVPIADLEEAVAFAVGVTSPHASHPETRRSPVTGCNSA